ncbi:hypothetical protein [Terasakiella sp. SH-1]|uniref:hypothetical protein n=1 Tax=Terasakiella sp. SH-1 TaxID=2560057 RepID=UPI001073A4EA|nr:hypothetical protein [Terasakiella sp. SH-1]
MENDHEIWKAQCLHFEREKLKSFAGVKQGDTRSVTRITTSRHIPKAANDNRQPTKQPPCAVAMAA